MKEHCILAENISKRFSLVQNRWTAFGLFKEILKRQPLTRDFWALKNLSFEIKKGERVALIGRNGAGKTTLLRLLAGIFEATEGNLSIRSSTAALFRFWVGMGNDLTVEDNIYLLGAINGLTRDVISPIFDSILGFAEIQDFRFSPIKSLSTGQLQRLSLSVFLHSGAELFILDEVLNYLDCFFLQKLEVFFDELKDSSRTLIIASHDTQFLRRHCTTGIWINEGILKEIGPLSEVLDSYEKNNN